MENVFFFWSQSLKTIVAVVIFSKIIKNTILTG